MSHLEPNASELGPAEFQEETPKARFLELAMLKLIAALTLSAVASADPLACQPNEEFPML
jgi:hypothetical protein